MTIDWSKAPEGATHYCEGSIDNTHWRDFSGETAKYWFNGRWNDHGLTVAHCLASNVHYTERPHWNGEGLPLAGIEVEVHRGDCTWIEKDEWQIGKTAKVMSAFENSLGLGIAAIQFESGHCECILTRCLRPALTAEQVAADERLHEIRNALTAIKAGQQSFPNDIVRGNITVAVVEAMIDAGYRKQVTP